MSRHRLLRNRCRQANGQRTGPTSGQRQPSGLGDQRCGNEFDGVRRVVERENGTGEGQGGTWTNVTRPQSGQTGPADAPIRLTTGRHRSVLARGVTRRNWVPASYTEIRVGVKRGPPSRAKGDDRSRRRRPACRRPARRRQTQRLLSRKAVSWLLDSAPTLVATTAPLRNSINVGIPRMPYLDAMS